MDFKYDDFVDFYKSLHKYNNGKIKFIQKIINDVFDYIMKNENDDSLLNRLRQIRKYNIHDMSSVNNFLSIYKYFFKAKHVNYSVEPELQDEIWNNIVTIISDNINNKEYNDTKYKELILKYIKPICNDTQDSSKDNM